MQTHKLLLLSALSLSFSLLPVLAQPNIEVVRNLVNKGNALMCAHHFQEAIDAYQEALTVDPGNPIAKANITEAHNNWGIFYFQQHKYKQAKAEWDKCLELTPNHTNAKRNLSILNKVCVQQGINLDEAAPGAEELPGETGKSVEKPSGPAGKVETPKAAPELPSAGAVILTPGIRTGDSFSSTAEPSSSVTLTNTPAPVAAPAEFVSPNTTKVAPSAPTAATVLPASQQPIQPAHSAAPPTPQTVPAATGGTIEDQIAAVEMKVYGQKQTGLTILQRLDKMERDTSGTTSSGTILERIGRLKQTFGL